MGKKNEKESVKYNIQWHDVDWVCKPWIPDEVLEDMIVNIFSNTSSVAECYRVFQQRFYPDVAVESDEEFNQKIINKMKTILRGRLSKNGESLKDVNFLNISKHPWRVKEFLEKIYEDPSALIFSDEKIKDIVNFIANDNNIILNKDEIELELNNLISVFKSPDSHSKRNNAVLRFKKSENASYRRGKELHFLEKRLANLKEQKVQEAKEEKRDGVLTSAEIINIKRTEGKRINKDVRPGELKEIESKVEKYVLSAEEKEEAFIEKLSARINMKRDRSPDESFSYLLRFVKYALEKEWLLSWHWRAILPVLRQFTKAHKSGKRLVLQISHIRKWELMLCYEVDASTLQEHKNISFVPRASKTLLRAPIFGISNRMHSWDIYGLLHEELVYESLHKAYKDLKKRSENEGFHNPREQAYLLGRHDCYYIIENDVEMNYAGNGYHIKVDVFFDFNPEKETEIDEIMKHSEPITTINPYDYIELPAFFNEEGTPLLLSSDNYCQAVEELTDVLNDPTAKSLLLIAPPGSGKENLAKIAYNCRNFQPSSEIVENGDKRAHQGRYVTTTVAGMKTSDAAKMLFRLKRENWNSEIDDHSCLRKDFKAFVTDGLLFQALGGTLFIDEIDKTSREIKDMLLRVLESGEVNIPDSSVVIKIHQDRIPLYIFAGSKPRREMFEDPPFDFWTRISHIVEMSHPLDFDDMEVTERVARDYIWMFWCQHVRKYFKKKQFIIPITIKVKGKSIQVGGGDPVNQFYREFYKFLLSKPILEFVSREIASEVIGKDQALISVRMIRHLVGRSVFRFTEAILHSKADESAIESFKEKELERKYSYVSTDMDTEETTTFPKSSGESDQTTPTKDTDQQTSKIETGENDQDDDYRKDDFDGDGVSISSAWFEEITQIIEKHERYGENDTYDAHSLKLYDYLRNKIRKVPVS